MKKLDSLTSLRFFAAIGVFLHHFDIFQGSTSLTTKIMQTVFYEGFIGVTFFYILSGFIISYSYENSIAKKTFNPKKFLWNRFSKVYPPHFITLLLVLFITIKASGFGELNYLALLSNALLLQSAIPSPSYYFSFNAVSWSISAELFFYLSFLLLIKLKNRALLVAFLTLSIIVITTIFYRTHYPELTNWLFYINPSFRILDFITGMLLCRFYLSLKVVISETTATILEVVSLLTLLLAVFIGVTYIPMAWRYDIFYITPMSMIILSFSFNSGIISKAISSRPFILLGEASFCLYLVHQIWISIMTRFFKEWIITDNLLSYLTFILTSVISGVILSIIMYKLYEKPVNSLLRNKIK